MATSINVDKKFRKEKEILFEFDLNVKDLRNQLNEQLKCIDVKVENEMAILVEIQDYFKRRSEIEVEYSRNLEKLVRNIQLRHKNEKIKRENWSLYTPYNCWQNILNRCRDDSKNHASLADLYMAVITPRLSQIIDDNRRIHLKCKDIGTKCHEEIFKVLDELITAMKSYHVFNTAFKISEQKLKLSESQMNKLEIKEKISASKKKIITKTGRRQEKYLTDKLRVDRARNEYVLCLAAANTTIYRFFQDDISDLIDCGSVAFQLTLAGTLQLYLQGEDRIVYSKQEGMKDTVLSIEGLDSKSDKQKFIEAFNTAFQLPSKIPFRQHRGDLFNSFIPNPEFGGELNVRHAQLSSRLSGLRTENDEIWKTLESAENLLVNLISSSCNYNVASLFSKDSASNIPQAQTLFSSSTNNNYNNPYKATGVLSQQQPQQPFTSELKPQSTSNTAIANFLTNSTTSSNNLSTSTTTSQNLPTETLGSGGLGSTPSPALPPPSDDLLASGDPIYVGGSSTLQFSGSLGIFTSSTGAKCRTERQEIEDFYLKKFQEYLLSGDLIARLQAKFLIIHNALQEISRLSKHNLLSDLELGNANALTPHEGAYLMGPSTGFMPLAPAPVGPASKRKRVIGAQAAGKIPKLFGGSLEEYLTATGQEIPLIIVSSIRVINLYGLHHQGIFRVSGSQLEINEFKNAFERGEDPLIDIKDSREINSVAGVLKLYLRELREPLFPIYMLDQFVALGSKLASSVNSPDQSEVESYLSELRDLLATLPKPVYITMRYLFAFLNHLSQYSDENMMDPYNLAVCFGPAIMAVPAHRAQVQYQSSINELIHMIIKKQDYIFPVDPIALAKYTGTKEESPNLNKENEESGENVVNYAQESSHLASISALNTSESEDMMIRALSGSNNYYSDQGPFYDKFCRYNLQAQSSTPPATEPKSQTKFANGYGGKQRGAQESPCKQQHQNLTDDGIGGPGTADEDSKSKESTDPGSSKDDRSRNELSDETDDKINYIMDHDSDSEDINLIEDELLPAEKKGDETKQQATSKKHRLHQGMSTDQASKYGVGMITNANQPQDEKFSSVGNRRRSGPRRPSLSFLVSGTRQSNNQIGGDGQSPGQNGRQFLDFGGTSNKVSGTTGGITRGSVSQRSFYNKRRSQEDDALIATGHGTLFGLANAFLKGNGHVKHEGNELKGSAASGALLSSPSSFKGGVAIDTNLLAVARYPFRARNDQELSFDKGDILRPLYKINADWWKAILVKSVISQQQQPLQHPPDVLSPETLFGIRKEGIVPHIYLAFVNTSSVSRGPGDRSDLSYVANFFREPSKRGKPHVMPSEEFTSPLVSPYRHSYYSPQYQASFHQHQNYERKSSFNSISIKKNVVRPESENLPLEIKEKIVLPPPTPPFSAVTDTVSSANLNEYAPEGNAADTYIHKLSMIQSFDHKTGQNSAGECAVNSDPSNLSSIRPRELIKKTLQPKSLDDPQQSNVSHTSQTAATKSHHFFSSSFSNEKDAQKGGGGVSRIVNREPGVPPPLHYLHLKNVGIFHQSSPVKAPEPDFDHDGSANNQALNVRCKPVENSDSPLTNATNGTLTKRSQLQRQGALTTSASKSQDVLSSRAPHPNTPPPPFLREEQKNTQSSILVSDTLMSPTLAENIKHTLISPLGIMHGSSSADKKNFAVVNRESKKKNDCNNNNIHHRFPYDGSNSTDPLASVLRHIDDVEDDQISSLVQSGNESSHDISTKKTIDNSTDLDSESDALRNELDSIIQSFQPLSPTPRELHSSSSPYHNYNRPISPNNNSSSLSLFGSSKKSSLDNNNTYSLPRSRMMAIKSINTLGNTKLAENIISTTSVCGAVDDSKTPPVSKLIRGFEQQRNQMRTHVPLPTTRDATTLPKSSDSPSSFLQERQSSQATSQTEELKQPKSQPPKNVGSSLSPYINKN